MFELLDEREVEYEWNSESFSYEGINGIWWFVEGRHDRATVDLYAPCATPEQAIEATLGRGTCHITVQDNLAETEGMGDVWLECDTCHWQMLLEPSTPRFKFCPNCGRKVVN
jgi:hypothetical protein